MKIIILRRSGAVGRELFKVLLNTLYYQKKINLPIRKTFGNL